MKIILPLVLTIVFLAGLYSAIHHPFPTVAANNVVDMRTASELGFSQFYKCSGPSVNLGDLESAASCLTACKQQPDALGCWWDDGSNGSLQNCRACKSLPEKMIWSNDWAINVTRTH